MKNILTGFLILYSLLGFSQISTTAPKRNLSAIKVKVDSNLLITTPSAKSYPVYTDYKPYKGTQDPAVALIDSTKSSASYIPYLDPNDILSVNIFRNKEYPGGVIYIKLKDKKLLARLLQSKLLTLHDITNTYIKQVDKRKPVIFLLNKELVTDTTKVRIPEMCLGNITVGQASQMPYFKTAFPNALIMMITTHIAGKPYQPDILIQ